jgi:hypothetical protein
MPCFVYALSDVLIGCDALSAHHSSLDISNLDFALAGAEEVWLLLVSATLTSAAGPKPPAPIMQALESAGSAW